MPRARSSNNATRNIAELFGHRSSPLDPVIVQHTYRDQTLLTGVEIEVERADAISQRLSILEQTSYWKVVPDASLRGGVEFVLRDPLRGNLLATAVRQFFQASAGVEARINARTSCHIHVEMRDATLPQLCGTIIAYQAAELGFWKATHTQRRWTGYCLPLMEAQGSVVAELLRNEESVAQNVETIREANRYCAFNLASLARHGSVEFRHFHNPASEQELNKWIDLCHAVKLLGYNIAACADTADIDVLSWAIDNVDKVVEWVIRDASLGELVTEADRAASTEALEKLLAVVESSSLETPVQPRRTSTPPATASIRTTMSDGASRYFAAQQISLETMIVDDDVAVPSPYPPPPASTRPTHPADRSIRWEDLSGDEQAAVVAAWETHVRPLLSEVGITAYSPRNSLLTDYGWPSPDCTNQNVAQAYRNFVLPTGAIGHINRVRVAVALAITSHRTNPVDGSGSWYAQRIAARLAATQQGALASSNYLDVETRPETIASGTTGTFAGARIFTRPN